MEELIAILETIDSYVWGPPLIVFLLFVGIFLTVRYRFLQATKFRHAINLISGKYDDPKEEGEITHFQALSAALSATIGTGNIAGVATAITLGGPGALFWMWVTAFFGMATKFTECTLALKFRRISPDGEVAGGPMYTLLHGLNMRRTAALFACFALVASFGIGNMVQANSVMDGLGYVFPSLHEYKWLGGVILATLVGMVILGGVRRIAHVASTIVPFMAITYISAAFIVLFNHAGEIPSAIAMIFDMALNPWSVGGAAVGEAIRWGVARGLFSNEAGLGSSPMAHAAARTNEPVREGLVAMMEPFIDTLVICTLTGLVIVVTGAWQESGDSLMGAALTAHAFGNSIGDAGAMVVGAGLALFAYSTMVSWSYYGERAWEYLFGARAALIYRVIFVCFVFIGSVTELKNVLDFSDMMILGMAFPNIIGGVILSPQIRATLQDYWSRLRAGEMAEYR